MKKIIIFVLFVLVMMIMPNVYAEEIQTGTYKIHNASDESKLLVEKDGNIELGDENSQSITTWNIYSDGNNYYIKSNDDTISLSINSAANNGTNVITNATSDLGWKLIQDGKYYYIKTSSNNYNIDVKAGSSSLGANIQLYIPNGTNAQKWRFERVEKSQQVIDDGTYIIKAFNNNKNVIDLSGANTSNSSNIQIYENNYSWAQLWNVKYDNGYYTISTYLNNNKVFDIRGGALKNSSNIQLYQKNNSDAQKWIIEKNSDDTYSIVSYDGLWTLDIYGGSTKSGSNLNLYQRNGTKAQKFTFEKSIVESLETGYYNINSLLGENMVVGINNVQAIDKKNVILTKNTDYNYTKWYIKKISGDTYTIANAGNKRKVLDVTAGKTADSTNVQLYQTNGSAAQKWIIRKNADNTYMIIGVGSKKVLDVKGATSADGTNIQIYSSNNTAAQKFNITPTTAKEYETPENGKYIIKSNLYQDKAIDVTGANRDNNTNIQLYSSNNTAAQVWKLENLGEGEYVIRSMLNPNTVLTAASSNVVLRKYNGSDDQKWYFMNSNSNKLTLYNLETGKFLNIEGNSNGTNVSLSTSQGNKNEIVLTNFTGSLKYRGIDVSAHNHSIEWANIRNKIDFVVIRAGYSGEVIQDGVDIYQDQRFLDNVRACEEYNIPYAYYLYSYAKSVDGPDNSVTNEARHMLNLIEKAKQYGKPNLSVQVYFDQEDKMTYNAVGYDATALTNIHNTFCSMIENNGYQCGLYTFLNGFDYMGYDNVRNLSSKYAIWIAHWKWYDFNQYEDQFHVLSNQDSRYNKSGFEAKYGVKEKIWQYSSEGNIPGANTGNGHIDLDIGYDIFD